MLHNTDTPAGVVTTSSPGLAYAALVYVFNQPIEKWVSAATLCFIVLQMFFLLRDRRKKRRERRAGDW